MVVSYVGNIPQISYLRTAPNGPFWDIYPDDLGTFELAIKILATAPPPPSTLGQLGIILVKM